MSGQPRFSDGVTHWTDPDAPTAAHPGYCFTFEQCGNCHRCQPDAPVGDGLVEQIARLIMQMPPHPQWSPTTDLAGLIARALVVAHPWQAEVETARQDTLNQAADELDSLCQDGFPSWWLRDRAARGETRQPCPIGVHADTRDCTLECDEAQP